MLFASLLLFYLVLAILYGCIFYSSTKLTPILTSMPANYLLLPFLGVTIMISINQTFELIAGIKYISLILVLYSLLILTASLKNLIKDKEIAYDYFTKKEQVNFMYSAFLLCSCFLSMLFRASMQDFQHHLQLTTT